MNEPGKKVKHLVICQACNGDTVIPDLSKPKGTWYESMPCPYCKGEGWVVNTVLEKKS